LTGRWPNQCRTSPACSGSGSSARGWSRRRRARPSSYRIVGRRALGRHDAGRSRGGSGRPRTSRWTCATKIAISSSSTSRRAWSSIRHWVMPGERWSTPCWPTAPTWKAWAASGGRASSTGWTRTPAASSSPPSTITRCGIYKTSSSSAPWPKVYLALVNGASSRRKRSSTRPSAATRATGRRWR
jgi:hypothetical protein